MADPPSPLLFLLLLLPIPLAAAASSADLAALLALKAAVTHDPAGALAAWSGASNTSHCHWRGVTCHRSSAAVAAIGLRGASLSGALPATLPLPPRIRRLDLAANNFSGAVPAALLASPALRSLDLSFNRLSAPLEIPLANASTPQPPPCAALTDLRLAGNLLVGGIPPGIAQCRALRVLDLSRNVLEGAVPRGLGRLAKLRVLDVSRNSLTDSLPAQLAGCRDLAVLVLTNLTASLEEQPEFNAFVGQLPQEVLAIPALQVLWAPRANLDGRLPMHRNGTCSLRALNLGQNYIAGTVPRWIEECQGMTFLDLSSNKLEGTMPAELSLGCFSYLNVSGNSLSGPLLSSAESNCSSHLIGEDIVMQYYGELVGTALMGNPFDSVLGSTARVALHDFSNNGFDGALPSITLRLDGNYSYGLCLDNNVFNTTLSADFFRICKGAAAVAVNLSSNQLSGSLDTLSGCVALQSFDAGCNKLSGSIPARISRLHLLRSLVLRANNLTGQIPGQFGDLAKLEVLDLSRNSLTGSIPLHLADVIHLEILMLDHNRLTGSIPPRFSELAQLRILNVSFNNLSGDIPNLNHSADCGSFIGNPRLHQCLGPNASISPNEQISSGKEGKKWAGQITKFKTLIVILAAIVTAVVSFLLVILLFFICERRKRAKISSVRTKAVVTFTDAPPELTYENLILATSNFSIQNFIGNGGFGATYKAELAPGFPVAVKRLAMERFQGLQQFDAEIKTLGRIRHRNLVTLIGYHLGESDTFLIYNYLSGGNLEKFIHEMGSRKMSWTEVHKIAVDIAQALAFLHCSCTPRIIHRDIKPSNILLDEDLNAYLSDFGLARLIEVTQTHATTDVAGTYGYVAPEYATTCRVSDKADVYSFGVVLLELMSGKRSLDPSFSQFSDGFTIVSWGRMLLQEGKTSEFFCHGLHDSARKDRLTGMLKIALSCTSESVSARPPMKQVSAKLKQLGND
jgi:Leucine-rich repeat (LRR) protein